MNKDELREDEFVERVMQAVDYVRQRYQLFVGGLVVVVALILVINYIIDAQEEARGEAATKLGEMMIADQEGNAAEALRLAQELIGAYAGTPAAAQGTLILANRYYAEGNYTEARRLYDQYLDDYGQNELLVYTAWSGIAACLEAQGQTQEAARKYQEFATSHPGSVQAALSLWEAARCYEQLDDQATRKGIMEQIIREYAKLPLAVQARAALAAL